MRGVAGRHAMLLLVGGDKRRQPPDITAAVRYWQDWQKRNAS
jgi:putative component of toxin-antitoxin plasmid stabilization module